MSAGETPPNTSDPLAEAVNNFEATSGVSIVWHPGMECFLTFNPSNSDSLIGGSGITARTGEEVEDLLPGITDSVLRANGKVDILGNGLSTAPLDFLKTAHARGQQLQLTLVDCFDYRLLRHDLTAFQSLLASYGQHEAGLDFQLSQCVKLCDALDAGELTALVHKMGSGPLPDQLLGAALVLNCHGPNMSTLDEQLACLAPGGRLYISTASGADVQTLESGIIQQEFSGNQFYFAGILKRPDDRS